jgi:hypothetical protein
MSVYEIWAMVPYGNNKIEVRKKTPIAGFPFPRYSRETGIMVCDSIREAERYIKGEAGESFSQNEALRLTGEGM